MIPYRPKDEAHPQQKIQQSPWLSVQWYGYSGNYRWIDYAIYYDPICWLLCGGIKLFAQYWPPIAEVDASKTRHVGIHFISFHHIIMQIWNIFPTMIRFPTNYGTVPGLTPVKYASIAMDQVRSLNASKIQPKGKPFGTGSTNHQDTGLSNKVGYPKLTRSAANCHFWGILVNFSIFRCTHINLDTTGLTIQVKSSLVMAIHFEWLIILTHPHMQFISLDWTLWIKMG